jgi:hypothetical protein
MPNRARPTGRGSNLYISFKVETRPTGLMSWGEVSMRIRLPREHDRLDYFFERVKKYAEEAKAAGNSAELHIHFIPSEL